MCNRRYFALSNLQPHPPIFGQLHFPPFNFEFFYQALEMYDAALEILPSQTIYRINKASASHPSGPMMLQKMSIDGLLGGSYPVLPVCALLSLDPICLLAET